MPKFQLKTYVCPHCGDVMHYAASSELSHRYECTHGCKAKLLVLKVVNE